jgi:hypothetical protein
MQVLDFAAAMDINIKMTSAEAPWQNGLVERHHATADIIFEKLLKDNPKMSPQEAVNHAAFAKNSDTNQTGFFTHSVDDRAKSKVSRSIRI